MKEQGSQKLSSVEVSAEQHKGATLRTASKPSTNRAVAAGNMNCPRMDRNPSTILFSRDGKYILATSTNNVEVISAASGKIMVSLEGHTRPVTEIVLHPQNVSQIFTSSLDGTLRQWNFSDGAPVKMWKLGQPISHMVMTPDASIAYASFMKPNAEGGSKAKTVGYVHRINLQSGVQVRLFKCRECARLALNASGDTLLAVARKDLWVWEQPKSQDADAEYKPLKFQHARNVAVVAAHPEGNYIATGDERGEIFLWHNILATNHESMATDEGSEQKLPFCSKNAMHWHAHAVRCLGVSVDGACLLSGGEEAVLVQWQVDTGTRQFLPRLGGPINALAVSPCGTMAAVLCEGQLVQVVNLLTRQVGRTVRMLAASLTVQGQCVSLDVGAGGQCSMLGTEPRCGYVVLNPSGTSIQLWDALNNRHVQQIDVTPRNWVSRTDDKAINAPRVQHVCFSADGKSMAAVHGRDRGKAGEMGLSQLSFWALSDGELRVQTRVEAPHGDKVTSMAYSPSEHLLLTAGTDRQFKLWSRTSRELPPSLRGLARLEETWRCEAVGSLGKHTCTCVAFSRDGTPPTLPPPP